MRAPPHSELEHENAIVRARLDRGETQAQAAKRLGVSTGWYCQMERRGWIGERRKRGQPILPLEEAAQREPDGESGQTRG